MPSPYSTEAGNPASGCGDYSALGLRGQWSHMERPEGGPPYTSEGSDFQQGNTSSHVLSTPVSCSGDAGPSSVNILERVFVLTFLVALHSGGCP